MTVTRASTPILWFYENKTMIEYLRGILLEHSDGQVVLDVGGVGYGLAVSARTAAVLGEPGAEAALWVRTWVREEALRLFGFATRHEREVFDVFMGLSGVGPAMGLAILSALSVGEIIQATMAGDASRFHAIKGIGPKKLAKMTPYLKFGSVKKNKKVHRLSR